MLRILAGERPPRPSGEQVGRQIPTFLWNIIEACWQQSYADRPSMTQVVDMMQHANKGLLVHEQPIILVKMH
ncbi:hypothetical protein C8J56DRAFT_979725 [Mycena floridula]|nr:hypothetical protein C8J56DRAFT_979725 [Mycena floridula]